MDGGFPEGLPDESFTEKNLLMVFAMVGNVWLFQHNSVINRISGSNITMLYLRRLWLQSAATSVLDESID